MPWQCPYCPYSAPVDSLLPEHLAAKHPPAEGGD